MIDFTNRMTSLTDIDGSVFAYEFDGEGNRLSQRLNDCLSKRFVYDGADVLLELPPTNGIAYAWVNGPGTDQPIERLLFIDGAPRARRVFHSDALGSITALTDPDGLVTQSYAYAAFGSLRSSSGTDLNRVTFTAREQLSDSQGWMYYRHRVYSTSLGRFTISDPMGFVNEANEWSYCINRPSSFVDALGLWFGIDDAFTGPVDEIIVIGSLSIFAFCGNETAQNLLDDLSNYFHFPNTNVGENSAQEAENDSGGTFVENATAASQNSFAAQGRNPGKGGRPGQGERGKTGKPGGTGNPGKHFRQDSNGRWWFRDDNGKWHQKPPRFSPFESAIFTFGATSECEESVDY